tara:strand:- start:969 stop:3137 length:2169 start_codon:yes stop_codon:yes gene_type:complete
MKKFLLFLLLSLLIVFISTTIFLSTIGYETNKFNNFLEQKLSRNIPYLKIKLENIKVKLDLKKVTFFITTPNPDIKFYGSQIKFKKINAYINFKSLLINEPKIDSVYIVSKNIDIKQAKDFVKYIKPSNSKKFFLNNINKGNFNFNLQFTFKDNKIKNYELDGFVKDFEANFKSYVFKDGSFVYNIGKNSGEMQNIRGNLSNIIINSGFIKYDITNSLEISGALDSEAKLNESQTERLLSKDMKKEIKVDNFMGKISSVFDIKFDKTLKLKDYNFKATGNLKNLLINFKKPKKIAFIDEVLEVLNFEKSNFTVDFSKKNNLSLDISGMFNINNKTFQKYDLKHISKKNYRKISLNANIDSKVDIPILNFQKENKVLNIQTNLEISKKQINLLKFLLKEGKSKIQIDQMILNKNRLMKFNKILVKTFNNDNINNDFIISFGKDIKISGTKYDATNLTKLLDTNNNSNFFKNVNKQILVNLNEIKTDNTNSLFDLNLIGKLEKGKLVKIVSKGEFSKNKYLEISLKEDKVSKKKLLEVYSDLPKPLLSNYSFFKGLSGGKLLLNSSYDLKSSNSKLIIENFKVKNAPGLVQLLSLADFGGMTDALSGEGLSFDKLEIIMEKNDKILNLKELYAIGPSISILMEGYVDSKTGLVSLRGTMVPAKTLNKFLSKVPFLGDILIPKEIGEGLFGISFKMKGPPGKIKTSVNPIKTLTPRFIQKALGSK